MKRSLFFNFFLSFLTMMVCTAQADEKNMALFLNGENSEGRDLSFQIDSISLIDKGGKGYPLRIMEPLVSSRGKKRFQIRLARGSVPEKIFKSLRIEVSSPFLFEEEASLLWKGNPIEIPISMPLKASKMETLFLYWDVSSSIKGEIEFQPTFSLSSSEPIVRSLKILVTDEKYGEVLILDRSKDQVVNVIKVGKGPKGLALSPDGERAYIANADSGTISIIDTNNDQVIDTMDVEHGSGPVDLIVSPDGEDLYMANESSHSVSIYKARSSTFIKEVKVGFSPADIVMSPAGDVVYVSCRHSDEIDILDPRIKEVSSVLKVSSRPVQMVVHPEEEILYVVHEGSSHMTIIKNRSIIKKINPGFQAMALNIDNDGSKLFLLDPVGGRLIFYDPETESMLKFVKMKKPMNVDADPDQKKLYITGGTSGRLYIIDKIVGKILYTSKIGGNLFDLVIMR